LLCASVLGQVGAVKLLLKKDANINHQDDSGCTSLIYASLYGFFRVVEALLEYKDSVLVDLKTNANNRYGAENTALMHASCGDVIPHLDGVKQENVNHAEVLKLLLEAGANENLVDLNGNSALDFAKKSDSERGTNLTKVFEDYHSALKEKTLAKTLAETSVETLTKTQAAETEEKSDIPTESPFPNQKATKLENDRSKESNQNSASI
jgi:ankyrin repeat protein